MSLWHSPYSMTITVTKHKQKIIDSYGLVMITEDLSSQLLSTVALRGQHSAAKEKTHAGYLSILTTHTQHLGKKHNQLHDKRNYFQEH